MLYAQITSHGAVHVLVHCALGDGNKPGVTGRKLARQGACYQLYAHGRYELLNVTAVRHPEVTVLQLSTLT